MAWKVDFTNDTEDTLDQLRAAPGWYRAVIESAGEEPQMGNVIVEYRITGPTFKGAKVKDTITNPENAQTEEKAEKIVQRAKKIMKRLGLVKKDHFGREVEIDWSACVGQEMVINVIHEEYEAKGGGKATAIKLGYLGCYPLDHDEIPVNERVRMGLPLLDNQALPKEGEAPAKEKGTRAKSKGSNGAAAASSPAKAEADLSDLVNI